MMINKFEISKQENIRSVIDEIRGESAVPSETVRAVLEVINLVREKGDEAILEMTEKYDGVTLKIGELTVPKEQCKRSWESLDRETKEALIKAKNNISDFAEKSLMPDWQQEISPGVTVGQMFKPLSAVGIYVPGGRFSYPSTVLMAGIPARVAGVEKLIFCIPPRDAESTNNTALAAAHMIGNCDVYRIGGAQAISAMAFGTETVPRCNMVAGPGNIYVATAKRLLSPEILVDLEAGPSEILVYSDDPQNSSFLAADMLAQLEHDPLAIAVIISESKHVIESVSVALRELTAADVCDDAPAGKACMVVSTRRDLSLSFINGFAPEHLELAIRDAEKILPEINSAGCVFMGPFSAVALGDYIAGPSHVLPTGGTANRFSGLSSQSFRRAVNVVCYNEEGFLGDAPEASLIARLEGLERHALSLDIRRRKRS